MPNHVTNVLTLKGEAQRVLEVIEYVSGEPDASGFRRGFDFEKIIPPPDNLESGNLSFETMKVLASKGIPDWYHWNSANWGTKWNAYEIEISPKRIKFQTAWAMPEPIFKALSKEFPDVEFQLKYADEDLGHNCGAMIFSNGNGSYTWKPSGCNREAEDFASELVYGCKYDELDQD